MDLAPAVYWATRSWCERRDSNPHWIGFKTATSGCWAMLASPIPVLPGRRLAEAYFREPPLMNGR